MCARCVLAHLRRCFYIPGVGSCSTCDTMKYDCWKFYLFCVCCFQAVQCQQEKCVAILLEHGADPNLADANGNTALHLAAVAPNTFLAGMLIEHNAHIDAQNKVHFGIHYGKIFQKVASIFLLKIYCLFLLIFNLNYFYPFRRDVLPLLLLSLNIIKRW